MADDLWLDPRLPTLLEIVEPTRQQKRRVERTTTPCAKCRQPLTSEDVCFADGMDVHRSCAELWNFEIFAGFDILMAQDEARAAEEAKASAEESGLDMGLILPSSHQEGGLWTPTSRTAVRTA